MTVDIASRIQRVRAAMRESEVDALVVTAGPDLRYLTGYDAMPLERLTALLLPADGGPRLVVPLLEAPEAAKSPAAIDGMEVITHQETDDAFALSADLLGSRAVVAVDDHMWATRVFRFADVLAGATLRAAGAVLSAVRMRKGSDEVASLRQAGAAIDRVHDRMGEFLKVGRTEREVGDLIAAAMVEEGHATADFVIVGSGPNGASPHHGVSGRVIKQGDSVVVDIGGALADGYCSDSTRTYVVGGDPDPTVEAYYDVLLEAQRTQCEEARPGVTAESVDRVGRAVISEAGYGEFFIHRTGHGIGLETHEEPYIVEGNGLVLEPGMAFSIEPGIYLPGRHGARIEDIVVVTSDGVERLNKTSRRLRVLEG